MIRTIILWLILIVAAVGMGLSYLVKIEPCSANVDCRCSFTCADSSRR